MDIGREIPLDSLKSFERDDLNSLKDPDELLLAVYLSLLAQASKRCSGLRILLEIHRLTAQCKLLLSLLQFHFRSVSARLLFLILVTS